MRHCAFILMGSLPVAWIAIGCVLLLLVVVMATLFVLKSREVATLKKQCEDLRETMRMMRYEEANLARMLHTASKPIPQAKELVPLAEEGGVEPDAVGEDALAAADVVEEVVEESEEELAGEEITEPEVPLAEAKEELPPSPVCVQDIEENTDHSPVLEDSEDLEPKTNEAVEEIPATDDVQPSVEQHHKQPINERRPAIPNDLFAMWFAENEETQEEEVVNPSEVKEESVAEGAKVEAVVTESPILPEEMVAPAPEDACEATPEVLNQEIELSKEDERFCRKLERIVNTRLHNPNLNIDIIAAQFGIGRTNFYRKVRELMGMSPNDYLRKCRMERAAELLRTTDLPISEVCVQVGVPDAQYFSKVFKVYFETTPSVYRENNNQ